VTGYLQYRDGGSTPALLARFEPATQALHIARRCGALPAQRYTLGARVQQLAMMLAEVEAALGLDV